LIPSVIEGHIFSDHRGVVTFINDFDLTPVCRMYRITHTNTQVFRGWQGHQVEHKWFHCIYGAFIIYVVQPDSWKTPSGLEKIETYTLTSDKVEVLHVPGGYVTGIKALVRQSSMLVYSDLDLNASKLDDYRFEPVQWGIK
jgi:dTDP-4-dehydrorhamnose 3,5-epimerase